MLKPVPSSSLPSRTYAFAARYILPIGLIILLASLPLLPDRSIYHKLYYGFICVPALLMVIYRPAAVLPLAREPIFLAFGAFVVWLWLSIGWSQSEDSASSLAKWPLYVLMLFLGLALMHQYAPRRLFNTIRIAAIVFSACTLYSLLISIPEYHEAFRLVGTGALTNPLLSSHLFGFFTVYWVVATLKSKKRKHALMHGFAMLVMLAAVLLSGSRTPLVGLGLTLVWLLLVKPARRNLAFALACAATLGLLFILFPESLLSRGLSYRPYIWMQALQVIAEHPWVGHGYNTPIAIPIDAVGMTFSEPHNFALGVLHDLGIIGFAPWLIMQLLVLWAGWKNRHDWRFVLVSAWMVYGIGAAMTEGGGILSRPKEHWFLIWIPLALMAALSAVKRFKDAKVWLKPLTKQELNTLCDESTVIEQDGFGPKVIKLKDGSFLKIFRRKQWLSSASLNPYGRRFALNSLALQERQIDTPDVLECFRLEDGATAVRYQPLPGSTLRQALERAPDAETRYRLVREAGRFLGLMHQRGVYFRSVHLGNVLVQPQERFALIDIADMRLFEGPLSSAMRQRNLKHMQRYPQDKHWLFEEQRQALIDGYTQSTSEKAARMLLGPL